ncbi:MAG: CheR family methyltransferase [Gemmatimonadaceae bacterium]
MPEQVLASSSIAWSTPAIAAIASFLLAETGLLFSETRRQSAEAGIARAMDRVGVRSHAILLQRMRREPAVLDEVLAELTIGETYFMRDRDQLDFIVNTAVASRALASSSSHPLRIWSAGCSSGEEAYSLAIMIEEAGVAPVPPHIVGTDIATGRLAAARNGRYGNWSFRGVPPETRSRYFKQDGRQFVLDRRIRDKASFHILNLAEDAYPSPVSGIFGMDVILCRNVLIYFDTETVERVAARLIDSLADGGWLFVGASDPMLGSVCGCDVEMTPAGMAYRRRVSRAPARVPLPAGSHPPLVTFSQRPANTPARVEAVREPRRPTAIPEAAIAEPALVQPALAGAADAYARGEYADAASVAQGEYDLGRGSAGLAVLEVRSLANLGELDLAVSRCTAVLDRYRDAAELHYLHAVLLVELNRYDEAMAAARRATYLDPALAVAHFVLGDAASRGGRNVAAHRAYKTAAELVAAMPGDAAVPAADGETALRLLHMAHFRLRTISDSGEHAAAGNNSS